MRRRSELSKTTVITVITVIATGEEKLTIRAASWRRAAPMAQTITAAAAQNIPRCNNSPPAALFVLHTIPD